MLLGSMYRFLICDLNISKVVLILTAIIGPLLNTGITTNRRNDMHQRANTVKFQNLNRLRALTWAVSKQGAKTSIPQTRGEDRVS